MQLPRIEGIIKRRILINYQVDPDIISKHLPQKFSPKIINGKAIIGICLIRLEQIRPKFFPLKVGIKSENVAHRIAVNWTDELGNRKDGVYIFRRDSNSLLNTVFGGRLFPGEHNRAIFKINETPDYIDMLIKSTDQKVKIHIKGLFEDGELNNSIFQSIDQMSDFFKSGSNGYSPVTGKNCYQGMCLIPLKWNFRILKKESLEVSYFKDVLRLGDDQLVFDSLVLMKDIPHEWQGLKTI
jgi:hypothetical protein